MDTKEWPYSCCLPVNGRDVVVLADVMRAPERDRVDHAALSWPMIWSVN